MTACRNHRAPCHDSCQKAFTLVEVMVVLLIAGILAGAVCLSLAGPERQARVEDVIGQIEHYDAMTRIRARQLGKPLRLVIHIGRNRIDCLPLDGDPMDRPLVLPDHVQIKRILLAGQEVLASTGEAALACSTQGVTPSYGLVLEEAAGGRCAVFFLGMTGQMLRVDERFRGDEVLKQLSQEGRDDSH